jgi:hypothetical protein
MTVFNAVYILSLTIAGAAAFIFGGEREQRVFFGLLAYWGLSVGTDYAVPFTAIMSGIFGGMLLVYSITRYGDAMAFVFFTICILAGIVMFAPGWLPHERGQGFAWNYWNFRSILLHVACLVLVMASHARYTGILPSSGGSGGN